MFPPVYLFSLTVTNPFYLFLFFFIFSLTLSTKNFCLSLIPSQSDPHLLLQSPILSQTLSSPSIAPKSKKSSYILSTNAFHLTHWNRVVRLTKASPLTYRSQQHLFKGVRAGPVRIFFFLFQAIPLIFRFDLFLGL